MEKGRENVEPCYHLYGWIHSSMTKQLTQICPFGQFPKTSDIAQQRLHIRQTVRVRLFLRLVCDRNTLLAQLDDTNRIHRAIDRRERHSTVGHEFANQSTGLGTSDCRLHTNANKSVRIIDS